MYAMDDVLVFAQLKEHDADLRKFYAESSHQELHVNAEKSFRQTKLKTLQVLEQEVYLADPEKPLP